MEGILLAACTIDLLPEPMLESAACRSAVEGGRGKGEESPSQHGAKLVITSVHSLVSQFTVGQVQKRFWV